MPHTIIELKIRQRLKDGLSHQLLIGPIGGVLKLQGHIHCILPIFNYGENPSLDCKHVFKILTFTSSVVPDVLLLQSTCKGEAHT